jgi:hypothetical protein
MAGFEKGSNLRAQLAAHNHDGTNSEAVTVGTVANNAITAAKIAANAVETAKIKDANVTAAKLATDAVETAKIKDANVTPAKLSAAAGARIFSYQVEDLAAGGDITGRCIFAAPAGIDVTVEKVYIIPQGTAAGIDDGNTCLVNLADGTNTLVAATYKTDPAFPADAAVTELGEVHAVHGILSAGEKLYLTVANGTTANPPAFMLEVVYTVADAA